MAEKTGAEYDAVEEELSRRWTDRNAALAKRNAAEKERHPLKFYDRNTNSPKWPQGRDAAVEMPRARVKGLPEDPPPLSKEDWKFKDRVDQFLDSELYNPYEMSSKTYNPNTRRMWFDKQLGPDWQRKMQGLSEQEQEEFFRYLHYLDIQRKHRTGLDGWL